jgi:outer membrane receptor protein involved in Fe transport
VAAAMLLATGLAAGQGRSRITGTVTDGETGKGIGFATITLSDSTSKPVAAWVSEGSGKFSHTLRQTGAYTLTVSFVGYAASRREVNIQGQDLDVGNITLDVGTEIDAVTVATTKPLVRNEIDKIAYSVESDPEAPVSTALDILRKVPLITVDAEDNVQMRGQSNYKVLVNGKSSSLMDKNFKEVIRSMPASSIKDIEVITSPSSKYEAEGVGGVINIITNRRSLDGYTGSVGLRGGSYGSFGGNAYLSVAMGKLTVSGNINADRQGSPDYSMTGFRENYLSDENRYTRMSNSGDSRYRSMGYQLEASYEIDTFNLVTLSMWGYRGGYFSDGFSDSRIEDADGILARHFTNASVNEGKFGTLSGTLDYQRTFPKAGKTFTLSYKLDNSPGESDYELLVNGLLDYESYQQRSENDTRSREQTLQADYVTPIAEKHTVEAGMKAILRQNGNDPMDWERATSDELWTTDPARFNALDYDQYIVGAYGSYAFKLKKFSAKAGARFEGTINDGIFRHQSDNTKFDNKLFNTIPYANLSYAPTTSSRWTLSYTQRLRRPGIWHLNPYVNDSNPLAYSTGNPELDSEVSHSFNASWGTFGSKLNISINANVSITNNAIENYTDMHPELDGVSLSTYGNIGKRDVYGLSGYWSWRPNGKFSISANMSGSYLLMGNGADLQNEGFAMNGSLFSTVSLWKNATANANVYYSSPRVSLQGKGMSFLSHGMGINQRLLDKKLTLNLSVSSPFRKDLKFRNEVVSPAFYQIYENLQVMRRIRVGLTYNFGKTQVQVKKARRTIKNEDVMQGGGSQGGGGGAQAQ